MKLAIFDFDGTLFPKDTLPFLLSQWKYLNCSRITYYQFFLSLIPLFLKYKLEVITKLSREQMKLLAVRKFNTIFKGKTEQELKDFFLTCSKEIVVNLNSDVVSELQKAKEEGFHTVLLSGTYQYLLDQVGKALGFDTVIGSSMSFVNGGYDPSIETEIVIGQAKLRRIREVFSQMPIDWQASKAYADGYSDLTLLEAVGQPVAVRPDAKLKPLAEQKNWRILT